MQHESIFSTLPSFARAFTASMFRRGFAIRTNSGIRTPKANRATHYTTLSVIDADDILSEYNLAFVRVCNILSRRQSVRFKGRPESGTKKIVMLLKPDSDTLTWRKCLGYYVGKAINRTLRKIRPHTKLALTYPQWAKDSEYRRNAPIVANHTFLCEFGKEWDYPKLSASESRLYFWHRESELDWANAKRTGMKLVKLTLRCKPTFRHVILPAMPDSDDMNPWRGTESRAETDPANLAERNEFLRFARLTIADEHCIGALNMGSVAKYVRAMERNAERSPIRGDRLTASAIRSKFAKANTQYRNVSSTLRSIRASVRGIIESAMIENTPARTIVNPDTLPAHSIPHNPANRIPIGDAALLGWGGGEYMGIMHDGTESKKPNIPHYRIVGCLVSGNDSPTDADIDRWVRRIESTDKRLESALTRSA